ncbi:MAG: hypothetical protein WCH62_05625 [Candidatus Omnitrophota bacterium]
MGQIRKVGNLFYIEFYARGLLYSQVTGDNEDLALLMLNNIEAKISQGEALMLVREINLIVFFEQFLTYSSDRFSQRSITRFIQTWENFNTFLRSTYPNVLNISHLTPHVIESYKIALIKIAKPKVVNLTILLLREILDYAIKKGFINDNPTIHIHLIELRSKSIKNTERLLLVKKLLRNNVSLGSFYQLLNLKDVAQIMYWSNFIPLIRDDIYT